MPAGAACSIRLVILAALVAISACGGRPGRAVAPLPADAYEHYLRGRIAALEGRLPEAIGHLDAAAASAPGEAPIRVAQIELLLRAGRHDEALRLAEDAQARWPHEPAVWLASGAVYQASGSPAATRGDAHRRAIHAYERACRLAPRLESAYLGLASVQMAAGQPERAEDVLRRLVRVIPDSAAGHHGLAQRLIERDQHARAVPHLRRVLEVRPEHIRARVDLARALRALGERRESIDTLRLAFDRSGGDPGVGEELFRQLLDADDRDGAIALLGQLDRDDLDDGTRLVFGYLYLDIGEHEPAMAVADAVLGRDPASAEARLLKATALAEARHPAEATPLLLEVAPEHPVYPLCRALAAELLARGGAHERALDIVERALAVHPRSIELIAGQARVHELAGRPVQARAVLRAAVAARPTSVALLHAYGAFEARQGKPARAVAIVERILAIEPEHPIALNFIGFSLADRGIELDRAERLLVRAVELMPGNAMVLDSLGWLHFRRGRLSEARAVLERAVGMLPRHPVLLWHLGEVLLAQRQPDQALAHFERALTLGPEPDVLGRVEARLRELRPEPAAP